MPIQCPYCRNPIGLKDAKPGRYTTKCPACTKKFLLAIPSDPTATPVVSGLRSEREAERPTVPDPDLVGTMPTTPAAEATREWSPGATSAADSKPTLAQQPPTVAETVPGASSPATGEWKSQATEAATRAAGTEATISGGSSQGFELATGALGDDPDPGQRPGEIPSTLGGYQVLKELGRGGMGAVYLARQLSLDRDVALKVMKPEWATNPTFVSRFTREAYAAAQLVHHNVVQIYDFGQDRGTSYFSMEFVRGRTLSDLIRAQKKLDPEVAVGYVLQAARGLKSAHDQSMIHRDIKPDNLLLNDQGVVKVADLGLVKTPAAADAEIARENGTTPVTPPGSIPFATPGGASITQANVAMGTPAFMAPEQARDAAGVDHRADIYSLGCTLYHLVTGRPPFEGKSVFELITKHQTEPIVPPETIVKRVPRALSEIILKMVAKRPEDRYANLSEVIKAFEDFLGIASSGSFSPREEHANLLSECADAFNDSPTARMRPKVLLASAAGCGAVVILGLLARQFVLAGGFLGLGLMTAFAYFIIRGFREKTHLFLKARELVLGGSIIDWLMIAAGLVLTLTVVLVAGLLWAWVAFGILAVLIALGLHFALDRKAEAERQESVERTLEMLRSMRLQGLDEDLVRQFVCKYSGERWEEFYEALFGYDAKLAARDRWGRGERGLPRKKFGAWRDPIVQWIEAKQRSRREARERKLFEKIEERSLEAQGVNLVTARRKAKRAAEAMVTMAAEIQEASRAPSALRTSRPPIGKALREAAEKPEAVLVERESGLYGPRHDGPLNAILGPKPRFLVGAALLASCLLWLHQNEMLTDENMKAVAKAAQEVGSQVKEAGTKVVQTGKVEHAKVDAPRIKIDTSKTRPLRVPMLPSRIAADYFNTFNPGVAGLILLVSSLFRGPKMALFAFPAAAIALLGPKLGIPFLTSSQISMAAGAALGVVGLFFGRSR